MKSSRERFCVDPKNVKLPLKVRLKIFFEVFHSKEENYFATIAIILLIAASLGMALCVPSIMAGPFSQFIFTIILMFAFGAAFIGIGIGIGAFIQEEFEPWYSEIMSKYEEKVLPLKKQAIEEVDDILLR